MSSYAVLPFTGTAAPTISTYPQAAYGSGTFPASPVSFGDPQATNYVQRFYTVTVP